MSDTSDERDDRDEGPDDEEESSAEPRAVPYARAERAEGSFFDIYKRGQGARVRLGTGAAAIFLTIWGAAFLYEKLGAMEPAPVRTYLMVGLPVLLLLAGGLGTYHTLARRRGAIDFLIATESEMKKVNWSTRREVIGATKVVIFVMVVMAVLLFFVDFGLMVFFSKIGVLRVGDVLSVMIGGGES